MTERLQRPICTVVSSFEKVASSGGGFQVRPIVERTRLIEDRDALLALHGRAASDVWTILTNPPSAGVGGADGPAGPKPTRRRRRVAA